MLLLQIAAGVRVLVRIGVGLTVTVTVKVAPGQVPVNGVTVYIAVANAVVTLVNV